MSERRSPGRKRRSISRVRSSSCCRRGFTPEGIIFPISAPMLKDLTGYDASLEEAFSRPLMALVEYSLDEEGRMSVRNDTARVLLQNGKMMYCLF